MRCEALLRGGSDPENPKLEEWFSLWYWKGKKIKVQASKQKISRRECSSHSTSSMLLLAADRDYYRHSQLIKMKRTTYCEVPAPSWYIHNTNSILKLRKHHRWGCGEIVRTRGPRHPLHNCVFHIDKKTVPMKSQKYGCLNKAHTMTTLSK